MEAKKIHVGELIESICKSKDVSQSDLAKKIGTSRQNIRSIYKRDTIDVKLLFTISQALQYDFFNEFRIFDVKEVKKPKVVLQVEIDESKINDVLKYIDDKELYKLLKRE